MVAHDAEARSRVLGLLRAGSSARDAWRMTGVHYKTIQRWARQAGMTFQKGRHGGVWDGRLPEWTPLAGRLDLDHRCLIQLGLSLGWTIRRIATELAVAPSTVSREIRRNQQIDGRYRAGPAQLQAQRRRARPKPRKLDTNPDLRDEVVARLALHHSPRQISCRLPRDFPGRHDMRVSHETIYQALYVQGRGALRQEIHREKVLRSGRKQRIPQSRLTGRAQSSWIGAEAMITQRPAEADDRAVPGHWEGDLILGRPGGGALITLVERASRYVLLQRLDLHDKITVADHLSTMIGRLPTTLRRTLTWDQGSEMAAHPRFTIATGCKVFFCDPRSPWQRGTNENTNGLAREFFPKGTDFTTITEEQVAHAEHLLNTRPRETLDWDTPTERLATKLGVALTP